MIHRRALTLAFVVVVAPACRLGGGDMPRAAPEVLVTDSRSAFEMDPLLDVTLAPLDAGADAADGSPLAAPPGPAATSYRATDAGVGAETPRDVSGPPQPQKPAPPPPPPAQSKPQPQPAPSAQPPPTQTPMPGMDHSAR